VFVMLKLLNEIPAEEVIVWELLPFIVIELVEGVRVPPLLVILPEMAWLYDPRFKVVPEPIVTFPEIDNPAAAVAEALPDKERSPAMDKAVPVIVFVPLPLKIKFEYPVVEPFGLIIDWALPLYSMVFKSLAAFKIPDVERERVPAILIMLFVPSVKVAPLATVTL